MKLAVFSAAGVACFSLLVLWLMTQLHYRIGSRHLKVLLFGLTIRRVSLTDIRHISKRRPSGIGEYWPNTLSSGHRLLTIERHTGLRKNFVITPRNRYVFMADLKNAIKRANPKADIGHYSDEPDDFENRPTPPSASLAKSPAS